MIQLPALTTGHLSNGFLGLFRDAATARASPCKRCLDAKSVSAQTAKVAYVKTPKRQTWRGGYMGSVYLILSLFVSACFYRELKYLDIGMMCKLKEA